MELIGDAALGRQTNHFVHHIATAGHDESHAIGTTEHARSHFHKIFGTFLHGDASQKRNDFVLACALVQFVHKTQRFDGVVHGGYLVRILVIFFDNGVACQVRHGDDVVGGIHALFLDAIHIGIDLSAATVVVGGMNVYDHRFAAYLFGKTTGGIGQPIVRMNHIELAAVRYDTGHRFVVRNLFRQIVGITSRKIDTTDVVRADASEIVFDAIAQLEILVGVHASAKALVHLIPIHIFPDNRHIARSDDVQETLVFVAPRFRYHKRDVHVGLQRHAFRQAVTCRAKSAKYVRWELPPKH